MTINKQKIIILLASSRSHGNTFKAVSLLKEEIENIDYLDLANYKINDFDYEYKHQDDFLSLINHLLQYDTIILATPIYWYTMSAQMKRFIDRLSDLLDFQKELGRKLRDKRLGVITSYAVHPDGKSGFNRIFVNIANYLGMKYIGCYFHFSGTNTDILENNLSALKRFIKKLKNLK